jgi:hypothetical protein
VMQRQRLPLHPLHHGALQGSLVLVLQVLELYLLQALWHLKWPTYKRCWLHHSMWQQQFLLRP